MITGLTPTHDSAAIARKDAGVRVRRAASLCVPPAHPTYGDTLPTMSIACVYLPAMNSTAP